MAIPDYQSLMLPVLRIAAEGETRVPIASDKIADQLGISADEREEIRPNSKQRLLYNRIHWAKWYLVKAGLIETPKRGVFFASEAGHRLLNSNPSIIDVNLLKTYPAFADFYNATSPGLSPENIPSAFVSSATAVTPEEQIDAAQSTIEAALKADLLSRILDQTPAFFESLIVDLLVAMDYGGSHENAALRLGKSGDGGIDGVVDQDRLGLDRIYVQAKRYAAHVGVGRPDMQGFVGSLVGFGATKGVFVTTSSFSAPALEFARGLQQRIILIDGNRLTELMIEFGFGVRVSRVVEVKRLDEDFFADE
ncbi:restriction endonuclease [Novosphingobium sp. Chol11]|uniref:restriction endonuclease n=1 Tax=Novosphingobium sp. Chol11 TaxID=1385763 RepID=UPI0025FFF40A|nr:restriction endonuclease [Novosphingobium sp. Chol11]